MKTRLATFLIAMVMAAQAWAYTARVTRVHDGDTLTAAGVRVRLYGIDAPELDQPGGQASRDHLASLVLGREVEVEPRDRDDYGRTVAVVLLPDGRDVNALMVKAGQAWVYRKYCRHCYAMRTDEAWARLRGLGLWSDPGPVPPWRWRAQHRRTR